MEVTKLPNKETLMFMNQIRPWIENGDIREDGVKFIFKEDTPQSILDLLSEIKDKLRFNVLN